MNLGIGMTGANTSNMEIFVFVLGVLMLGFAFNRFTTDRYLRLIIWTSCATTLVWFSVWMIKMKFVLIPIGGMWRV